MWIFFFKKKFLKAYFSQFFISTGIKSKKGNQKILITRRGNEITPHIFSLTSYSCLYCLMCKHKISTWGKTDDTVLFMPYIFFLHTCTHFLQHQFHLWHNLPLHSVHIYLNAIVVICKNIKKCSGIFSISTKVWWSGESKKYLEIRFQSLFSISQYGLRSWGYQINMRMHVKSIWYGQLNEFNRKIYSTLECNWILDMKIELNTEKNNFF